MSDAAIIIEVKDKGSAVVKRNLDEITASAQKTEKAAFNLEKAFRTVGGIEVTRRLINMSDSFTRIKTGIENVTKSTAEYNVTFDKLFGIAQRSGIALDTVTKGFVQLNVSVDDNIRSTTDLAKVTEIFSRGLAAAGANANTSQGVMLQLSQGLATNFKAAGQELNSLIEGAPILAQAIAVELGGKSAADLKILAEQGELTTKSFLGATIAVEDAVMAFAIPPTVSASWIRFRNAFTVFMGESQVAQGIFNGLASTLGFLANNFDDIADAIIGVSVAIGILKLPAILGLLGGLIAPITGAIGAFGALASAVGLASAANIAFTTTFARAIALISSASGVLLILGAGMYGLVEGIKAVKGENTQAITVQEEFNRVQEFAVGVVGKYINASKEQRAELRKQVSANIVAVESMLKSWEAAANQFNSMNRFSRGLGRLAGMTGLGPDIDAMQESVRGQAENLKILKDSLKEFDTIDKGASGGATAAQVLTGTTDKGAAKNVKEIAKSIGDANNESGELLDYFKDFNSETRQLNNHISDVFANFVTGSMSAKEGLRSIAQEMISLASRSLFGGNSKSGGIAGALFSAAGSLFSGGFGSAGNSIGQSIGSIFSSSPVGPYKLPGFANGGSMTIGGNPGVDKNLLSLNGNPIAKVGRGETLSVNPNSTGQQPIVVNQTINLSTGVQQTVRAEVMRMLPQIQQVTTSGVEDARMRGAFA